MHALTTFKKIISLPFQIISNTVRMHSLKTLFSNFSSVFIIIITHIIPCRATVTRLCVCPMWRTLFRFNFSFSYCYEWNKRIRVLKVKVCGDLPEYYTNRTNITKTWTNILKHICFGWRFKKHITSAERWR